MKTIINRIIPCFLALLLLEGCTNDVFSLLGNKQQNPQMSIEAWTETALTKTLLSGEPDDSVRSICFLPLDSIAYSADLGEFEPFVNLGNDTLPYATFTGNLVEANMYFAVYPWKQAVNLNSDTLLVLNLPYVQQYKAGGVANGAYPMVSWSYDTDLYFKNLCGLLKLNLQGNAVVTSLSLCAPGLAGLAGVDMRYQGVPRLIMPTPPAYDTLRLDCGQGVQLDSLQATPFYFVLPPALYDSMTLIVRTSDQQQMTTTTRNLRIVRSSVTPTSVIEFDNEAKIYNDYLLQELSNNNNYVEPNGGKFGTENQITLNYWNIPKVVLPGQVIKSSISYSWNSGCPGCIVYKSVFGEWQPETPLAILENGISQGYANSALKEFSFTAPSTPGTYRIRLIMTWAYSAINCFYGDGLPGTQYDPGVAPFSEVVIRVEK